MKRRTVRYQNCEDYLSKRNKNKNTKALNAKPKFTPRENPSPPPIHQPSETNNNTTTKTQNTQPTSQKHIANCHITQNIPHNANDTLYQQSTNHTVKRACAHTHTHTIYQPSLP